MNDFASLTLALDGYFDTLLCDLPDAVRERVEKDFLPMPWDYLSADRRRSIAVQWDSDNDPAHKEKRDAEWDEDTVGWDYWQQVPTLTAQDFCILRHVHDPREFDREQIYIPDSMRKTLGEQVNDDVMIIDRTFGSDIKKPIHEWVVWAQQKGWDIPSYFRDYKMSGGTITAAQGITETINQKITGNPCDVFRAMDNLRADELSITFVGDTNEFGIGTNNILEISARGETKCVALAAIGLIDLHRRSLNEQCAILLGMALKKN